MRTIINRLKSLLITLPFILCSGTALAQIQAGFTYDATYGGLTQYHTPDNTSVNITRNGFGRHPVKLDYNSHATVYNFQDNATGRRMVQERTIPTIGTNISTVKSHFLYGGGLRPRVEFRNDDGNTSAHYSIYGPGGQVLSYVSVDSSNNTTRLTPIHDRLGSTRALVQDGQVEARFAYNTLGKPNESCEGLQDGCADYPYRFQGHRYLTFEEDPDESGYIAGITDNVDRFYSHDHGLRFMHTDRAGQSISPYTAYGNDAVNMVDLDGFARGQWLKKRWKTMSITAEDRKEYRDMLEKNKIVLEEFEKNIRPQLEKYLRRNAKDETIEVKLAGSRKTKTHHRNSDLDLKIVTKEKYSKKHQKIAEMGQGFVEKNYETGEIYGKRTLVWSLHLATVDGVEFGNQEMDIDMAVMNREVYEWAQSHWDELNNRRFKNDDDKLRYTLHRQALKDKDDNPGSKNNSKTNNEIEEIKKFTHFSAAKTPEILGGNAGNRWEKSQRKNKFDYDTYRNKPLSEKW